MRIHHILSLFLSSSLLSCAVAQKSEPVSWSIPVEDFRNAMIVPVQIEDRTYRFFFDTGAPGAINVSRTLADKLDLPLTRTTHTSDMLGNRLEVNEYEIPQLQIAHQTFRDVTALAVPAEAPLPDGVDGILGKDLFKKGTLVLDFPGNTLSYSEDDRTSDKDSYIPFTYTEGHITVPLSIDQQEVAAHLDSGNISGFALPEDFARETGLDQLPGREITAQIASGPFTLKIVQLPQPACVAGYCFQERSALIPAPANYAGIGAQALKNSSVTIDFPGQLLAFD
ncbi:hypothetical protein F6455_07510 [Proteobacteria bacterium 005FR1]|nr:hypothetical protein [Proteobacteria bacterium 005FR1]